MLQGWFVILVALVYIGLLFVIASYGDRLSRLGGADRPRPLIYALSLAIYCTSWTFFGSVGLAARSGFDFLAIYIGPAAMIGLASPLIAHITRLSKKQNIVSIADFIGARYGKHQGVAATVAMIAIIGMVPYIALQLKAVSSSLDTIVTPVAAWAGLALPVPGDPPLLVAVSLAAFAILFGTRHIDATEHQHGLMLAIAVESIVKLVAFLAVGIFVTFVMFEGPVALFAQALERPETNAVLTAGTSPANMAAITLLSLCAIILLPRQFYVTVVENKNESEIRRAAWLFPVYLVLINLFVAPVAIAGMLTLAPGTTDSDMYVLALPISAGSESLALVAFVGGLSAAAAMVIVETIALAIMVSNDIVVPLALMRRHGTNVGTHLLTVRRVAIFAVSLLAYLYYRSAGEAQLAAIGLMAFAAIAQLAPAFFGGLMWRRATAGGALAGMTIGILVWAYTLLLPSLTLSAGGMTFLEAGPFGIGALRPQALFGFDLPPLINGMVWSLALNLLAYVLVSLRRRPTAIERIQADIFVPHGLPPAPSFRLWRSAVTVQELTVAVGRYLGEERTRISFEGFAAERHMRLQPDAHADFELLRYAERLLASAIGAASSRLVLSLLLRQRMVSTKAALKLLDDANAAIHYNREILQTALDHVRQGIAVFDKDGHLICWNRQFGELLGLPNEMVRIGIDLAEILRFNADRGAFGPGNAEALVRERLPRYAADLQPFLERFPDRGLVIEVRVNRMPDGGVVITLTDITPSVAAAEALSRANENLERRVRERTIELERLNAELAKAKSAAEAANLSKTRFLAAASHDILQPLHAARLYVTSLVERLGPRAPTPNPPPQASEGKSTCPPRQAEEGRTGAGGKSGGEAQLVANIDASLEAVEDILSALLEISRLDAGAMKPEIESFRVDELLDRLHSDFAPLARTQGLDLIFMPCSLSIRSDRRLLRRLLQNLISNAIKYTLTGRVLVGCRRRGSRLRIDVYDTGIGIPPDKRDAVFAEFHRLDQGARVARGIGLGLSIVERIARVLDHPITLASQANRGTHFSVEVPLAPTEGGGTRPQEARIDPGQIAETLVLCLDNDPKILDGMSALLRGWDCETVPAADLPQAIAGLQAAGRPPGGLLVDYHLDRGNGIEAVAELRRLFGAEIPAVLITADRSAAVREGARAHGIQVLNKPLKPASLRALMSRWTAHRAASLPPLETAAVAAGAFAASPVPSLPP
ncbi:MAG TPA: PAS-domain containing protein [Xanthobacteraceae bacterium]|jgi:Na+/proline symporter/signal transduction histidine kinase|nr:PAS-domain containing protein [Xanthobacteraceae bacterium]